MLEDPERPINTTKTPVSKIAFAQSARATELCRRGRRMGSSHGWGTTNPSEYTGDGGRCKFIFRLRPQLTPLAT